MREAIIAFVPLTVATHRFVPIVLAHCFSNAVTTFSRDQTPLLIVSSTSFSSDSGIHIGHFFHVVDNMGLPPNMAGLLISEVELANTGEIPVVITATPAMEFCFKNSRRVKSFSGIWSGLKNLVMKSYYIWSRCDQFKEEVHDFFVK